MSQPFPTIGFTQPSLYSTILLTWGWSIKGWYSILLLVSNLKISLVLMSLSLTILENFVKTSPTVASPNRLNAASLTDLDFSGLFNKGQNPKFKYAF